MSNEPLQDDSLLLKLHRQYSKDECAAVLFAEIKKLQFQIGEHKSYIAELEDENKNLKKPPSPLPSIHSEKKADATAGKKHSAMAKQMIEWRNKYFSLLASTQKISLK